MNSQVIQKKFLNHIHYFRGFAIINIVIAHIWHVPFEFKNHQEADFVNIFREVIFHGSTIYFIFISGFLFYYLSFNFKTGKYYKNKIFNVISPYIFISFFILLVNTIPLLIKYEFSIYIFLKTLLKTCILGSAQVQYWYIPFISLIFLISPLILKIPKTIFFKMVLIGCFLPLFGSRSGIQISIGQYIYFVPIYFLGIYTAMNYSNIICVIKNNISLLISLAIISTVILIFLKGEAYYLSWINVSESVFYIQKISVCFLTIIILAKFENKKVVLLDFFAKYSFAMYFIHLLVKNSHIELLYYNACSKTPDFILPLSVFFVITVIFITLSICLFLKKILGKYSRFFIGV